MDMRRRERRDEERPATQDTASGSAQHDEAYQLLDAGREAIDRALSSDSESFMRSNRQQGGQ